MPEVQSEIEFAFEVLGVSLGEFARIDTTENAALAGAFQGVLYGARQADVTALLTGPVGRPLLPVTSAGLPTLGDCWSRVLAAIAAYNALDTGLQLVSASIDPQDPDPPHCVKYVVVNGEVRVVYNWDLALTFGGDTAPVFDVSSQAGIVRQVLALGHAGITVPIAPA